MLVITTTLDLSTSYPFLQTVPNVTVLVQPFDYRTFLARVEQALQKAGKAVFAEDPARVNILCYLSPEKSEYPDEQQWPSKWHNHP
jgi:hypothetical protein